MDCWCCVCCALDPGVLAASIQVSMSAGTHMRTDPTQILHLFTNLDTNKNGSVDWNEFQAFLIGKYRIPSSTVLRVFESFDTNEDKELDLDEFIEMVTVINELVGKYDIQKAKEFQRRTYCVACSAVYSICCCPCTICMSCLFSYYVGLIFLQYLGERSQHELIQMNRDIIEEAVQFAQEHDTSRIKKVVDTQRADVEPESPPPPRELTPEEEVLFVNLEKNLTRLGLGADENGHKVTPAAKEAAAAALLPEHSSIYNIIPK